MERLMAKVNGGNDGTTDWRGLNPQQLAFFNRCRTHAANLAGWRNGTTRRKPDNLRLMLIGMLLLFGFTAQQRHEVLTCLIEISGAPGTGKTFTVQCCIEIYNLYRLTSPDPPEECTMICAPTAVAAQLFEKGTTIHTLMGYVGSNLVNIQNNARGTEITNQFRNADLLVQDEFSMLHQALEKSLIKRSKQTRGKEDEDLGDIPMVILSGISLFYNNDLQELFVYVLACFIMLGCYRRSNSITSRIGRHDGRVAQCNC
jgi:dephospho-CoA kinase